jgi:hypothetical protein
MVAWYLCFYHIQISVIPFWPNPDAAHKIVFVYPLHSIYKRTQGDFIMVDQHSKNKNITASKTKNSPESKQEVSKPEKYTAMKMNESASQSGYSIHLEDKRMGGSTAEDNIKRGEHSPILKKHRIDDSTADHYGSREETNAALEDKIAVQNTLKLHEHF